MDSLSDPFGARFEYESWRQPDAAGSSLGWGFRLLGNEIAGWAPQRIQVVDLPDEPRANLSVWRPAKPNGQLLAINVFECDSSRAARAHLLGLLGRIADTDVQRAEGPGDVAFHANQRACFFARDNHVATVRNLESAVAPISDIAHTLDRILTGEVAAPGDRPPELRTLRADTPTPLTGEPVALHIDVVDPAGPTWVRLDAPSGCLRIENGGPVFVPDRTGDETIRVRIAGPEGSIDQALRITARSPDAHA